MTYGSGTYGSGTYGGSSTATATAAGGQTAATATSRPAVKTGKITQSGGRITTTTTPAAGGFTGAGNLVGGVTAATTAPLGVDTLVSTSQAARQSAGTAIGSAAFVGSLLKTVETNSDIKPAGATVATTGGPQTATPTPDGAASAIGTTTGGETAATDPIASVAQLTAGGGLIDTTSTIVGGRTRQWLLRPPSTTIPVTPTTDIEVGPQTISLTTDVSESNIDAFREFADRAGDLDTESGFGGSFRTLNRGTGDTVEVIPGVESSPPVAQTDMFVASYSESQLSPVRFEVDIELQRLANRDDATDPDTLQTGDEWAITLDTGATIGLSGRQVAPPERDGSPSGASVGLEIIVSSDQAAAILDRIGYPAGVVERSVPDGDDQLVDESGGRQTIAIDAPPDAAIDSGEWLVRGWGLSFNAFDEPRRWRLSLSLGE